MNFFEQQEKARQRTSRLVFFYGVAVVLIIIAIYFIVFFTFKDEFLHKAGEPATLASLWNPGLLMAVSVVVGMIILIGTLYKIVQLSRGGGVAVAEMLGGRLLAPNSSDFLERRILNVVEEMALASGIPVPRVYLLDNEESINAFAAGFSPGDAVIGVTRGCVQKLTRDELQGVIAHEFSHVFNGDMRLNLRLMGVLNGILVIALVGYWIFRMAANSSQGQSRSRDRKGGGAMAFVLFGLAVMVIGYIGVFFAKIIKSAVSRQREFLADASSVQYTRNPMGIAGALKKIGGWAGSSTVQSPKAEEASHLFFANGLKYAFFNLMATHPPLDERIRQIDPQFDGVFPKIQEGEDVAGLASEMSGQPRASFARTTPVPPPIPPEAGPMALTPETVSRQVGAPQREHLRYAMAFLATLPDDLKNMAREPQSAQALVLALLLSRHDDIRARQLAYIGEHIDPAVHDVFKTIISMMGVIGPESRLPLADLCLAALRNLSGPQYEAFRTQVMFLSGVDQDIDLFEYAVLRMLVRNLDPLFRKVKRPVIQYYNIKPVAGEIQQLLSALAWAGSDDAGQASIAFKRGFSSLGLKEGTSSELMTQAQIVLENLDEALDKLASTSMAVRKRLLDACASCVAEDGRVTVEEGELFRAIADSLDCPMPPLINRAA